MGKQLKKKKIKNEQLEGMCNNNNITKMLQKILEVGI